MDLKILETFPARGPREANTIVKAARMYQQAVWIADSDPALASLLLISAVETAAVAWAREEGSARERLEASLPQVVELLQDTACADLIDPLADILQKYTRATKKFIDFLLAFIPPPPLLRPTEFLRFSFKPNDLKTLPVSSTDTAPKAFTAARRSPCPCVSHPNCSHSTASATALIRRFPWDWP